MNESLKEKLKGFGLNDDQISGLENEGGVLTEEDLALLSDDEIKKCSGCGLATAKKIAAAYKPAPAPVSKETAAPANVQPTLDILPQVPDDTSFLAMLKTGGELKVGTTEVIAAIRSALADNSGLYELPKIIINRMEKFAEEQEQPCGKDFYTVQKLVTRRNYAEIFAVLEVDTASVTQAKKDALLGKLRTILWPALSDYNQQVVSWVQAWQQGSANPAAMMMAFTAMMSGGQSGMPAGMLQPPDTNVLRDGAEGVIDKINRAFAGTGIIIARALAFDANHIKEILENPALPIQVGATNHEQMLKMFEVNVSADYVRLERNITRYALAIMEFPKITSGQAEIGYLNALFQLGSQIPWDKLLNSNEIKNSFRKESRPGSGSGFREEDQ